ncbi:Rieske (2Fe-2S) protein [Streptomyces sp. NPDC059070]|uniref:Rieske (2Fe-2S) protein n=1 Tax=unclassified Streptomyces TaxID=2593676 RepID=UPI0034E28938
MTVDDEAEKYIEALLRSRRPKPFRARPEDAAEIATAITLRAARPGAGAPSEEFVAALHERLAAQLDEEDGAPRGGTRRRFVRGASIAAAAAGAAVLADRALLRDHPEGGPPQASTLQPNVGAWHTVATSAELPHGAVRPFDTGVVTGFVTRLDGRLRAVSGVCTHQGCRLVLDRAARMLGCPCHNSVFALTGEVVHHQFPRPLPALPRIAVRETGDAVQVYVPTGGGVTPPPIHG